MASITYIALRSLEATGYSKIGIDISVLATDDSFNATSTSLLGLLNDQWVQSSGFANAVNNGWFQVNGNSTATKISQDTTTALIAEAAGPQITLKGYYRGYGQSYSMDFGLSRADRRVKQMKTDHQPIGPGVPETVFFRDEVYWDLETANIKEVNMKQWREFLASVGGGETFIFDPYGTAASPVDPRTVTLDSDNYSERRMMGIYPSEYRIPFAVRDYS